MFKSSVHNNNYNQIRFQGLRKWVDKGIELGYFNNYEDPLLSLDSLDDNPHNLLFWLQSEERYEDCAWLKKQIFLLRQELESEKIS